MRVHYLQHVLFEELASIEQWVLDKGYPLSATKFYTSDSLPQVDDIDWVVVLGRPMNIYEDNKYPWLTQEKRFIKEAIKHNKTVIGICLGSQLIADVLGAKVYPGRYQEIGWFPINTTNEAQNLNTLSDLAPHKHVFHWHGDTFDLPQGATRLAYSEACQNQAFIYGNKVLALQFHLESTKESVRQIIENCSSELIDGKYIQKPEEMLSQDENFYKINMAMRSILNNLE